MKLGCHVFSFCICLILNLLQSECADCDLPEELKNDNWIYKRSGESDATVFFGTTTLSFFPLQVQESTIENYTCVIRQNLSWEYSIILFRSDSQYNDSAEEKSHRIYLCMKLTMESDNLFYFFLLNDEQNTTVPSERISTHQDDNVTISIDSLESTFCKYDINNPPDDVRTLQRSGTNEELSNCTRLCEPLNGTCESVTNCPVIKTVLHSTKTTTCNSNKYIVSFTCTNWYEMTTGNSELTCADNGAWSGILPMCSVIMCEELGDVSNSQISPDIPKNNVNDTVIYNCNTGYKYASGNMTRTCMEDKQWSGLPPVCTVKDGLQPYRNTCPLWWTRFSTNGPHSNGNKLCSSTC